MSTSDLPSISALSTLPTAGLTSVLDTLFEPSTPLHTLSLPLLRTEAFQTYAALISAVGTQLTQLLSCASTSDTEWLDSILGAHPRLGAKKVESAQSAAEQAQLQGGGEGEAEVLKGLNEEYEGKFPGLIYVVFVNGRPRSIIMDDMRSRIDRGDIRAERQEAIKAMCDIANDRARKLSA